MRIEKIRNFIIVVDSLSITKAAEQLYISQSVLSKQITSIEQELGVTLFERSKSGIRLTLEGAVAYENLSKVIQAYDTALHRISSYKEDIKGSLCIGKLVGGMVPKPLFLALEEFGEKFQNVSILRHSFSNEALRQEMVNGTQDVFMTCMQDVAENPGLEYYALEEVKNVLVVSASHPLAGKQNVKPEDFKQACWVTMDRDESSWHDEMLRGLFDAIGINPQMHYASDMNAMIDLISDGLGVGVITSGHILYRSPSLAFIETPYLPTTTIVLAMRKSNKNPLVKELIKLLKKYL